MSAPMIELRVLGMNEMQVAHPSLQGLGGGTVAGISAWVGKTGPPTFHKSFSGT